MNRRKAFNEKRERRARRTRAKILGTALKPRLAVFRSNRHIHAQLIDDAKGHTLLSVSTVNLGSSKDKKSKSAGAETAGEALGKKALEAGIGSAVFDRRSYKYHGRVKAVAEGARRAGLKI